MTMMTKAACFTDIHWGKKNNSELHNEDCLRYIKWFCKKVKNDEDVDHIIFMGDWFEHRSAINGLTLDYAYKGAKLINELGLPVYFIVGNHDLYYRTTRDVYSTNFFDSLGFIMINEPQVIKTIGNGTLMTPFLFEKEYAMLAEYFKIPVWFGHFEFKGFVITGDTKKMEHGPDPTDFTAPKRIFSGHFHKRQEDGNIVYIGNTFPVDFSDANDSKRGMMFYNHDTNIIDFHDWEEAPSYLKTTLSKLISSKNVETILRRDATVECVVDIDLNYEDSLKLKEQLTKKYSLRGLNLKENPDKNIALEDTTIDAEELNNIESTKEMVRRMLNKIETDSINNDTLIKIWEEL